MTNSLATARQAIASEIKRLAADQVRLQKILKDLDGDEKSTKSVDAAPATAPATGKRKYTRRAKASENDVQTAVKLIEKAGKGGIKAIKLAHEIKRAGGMKVAKNDLLATDKVKMTGTGGGSTYIYVG